MRVTAEDKDDPETDNAVLSYSIVKQESIPPNRADKNMFGIRENTGEIYILEGVDREVGVNESLFSNIHNQKPGHDIQYTTISSAQVFVPAFYM